MGSKEGDGKVYVPRPRLGGGLLSLGRVEEVGWEYALRDWMYGWK